MKTIIIVAMTRKRVIGKAGRIPWHDSEDLKHFKQVTTGHAVIMGRKTFESVGKVLPGRRNIVVTRRANADAGAGFAAQAESGVLPSAAGPPAPLDFVHSLDEALDLCRRRNEEKAFIIGGGQIYALALPVADEMIVTWIDRDDITGDTLFPEWDAHQWVETTPLAHAFPRAITYRRVKP
ncbi:MAG TPA: dihydrofolate reductase [Phycisphaerae bacterium]|nr:dihydrofolate reductase [Phycisphaerae bacterium]